MDELISIALSWLKGNPYANIVYIIIMVSITVALLIKFVIIPIYKHIYLPVHTFIKLVYNTLMKVDFLEKEMKPNGGSSLRDAVTRIEVDIKGLTTHLNKAESRQEALLEFLGMGADAFGFFESDKNGECVYVSQKYCEITGLLEEDALGMGWISSIHTEDRDKVFNEWKTCTNQHRAFILTYRIRNRRNNNNILVNCYAIPIKIEGTINSYIGTIREIKNE